LAMPSKAQPIIQQGPMNPLLGMFLWGGD